MSQKKEQAVGGTVSSQNPASAPQKIIYVELAKLRPHPVAYQYMPTDESMVQLLMENISEVGLKDELPFVAVYDELLDVHFVVNGLTRLVALHRLKQDKAPVYDKVFKDDNEIKKYVVDLANIHRSKDDRVVLRSIEFYFEVLPYAPASPMSGKGKGTAELIGQRIGVGHTKVEEGIKVLGNAEYKILVLEGKLSIHAAYLIIRKAESPPSPLKEIEQNNLRSVKLEILVDDLAWLFSSLNSSALPKLKGLKNSYNGALKNAITTRIAELEKKEIPK
ncbi:MAG: hypothetical protein WAX69_03310 [Victivallales bacterium]